MIFYFCSVQAYLCHIFLRFPLISTAHLHDILRLNGSLLVPEIIITVTNSAVYDMLHNFRKHCERSTTKLRKLFVSTHS